MDKPFPPMTEEQLVEMDLPQVYKDNIERVIGNWIGPETDDERLMANYYRRWQVNIEIECGITEENMERVIVHGYDTQVVWFMAGWEAHQDSRENVGGS